MPEINTAIERSLTISPALAEVASARRFISEIAREAGFAEERVFDITVASSEAVANAVEHAPIRGHVTVKALLHRNRLEVQVEGPGEFQTPDRLKDRSSRGLGLPLMAKLCDHLALYSGPAGGTLVALTFYLPGVPQDQSVTPPWIAELLQESEFVRTVTESVPVGLYVLDPHLRFRWANAAYRNFLEEPYRFRPLEGHFIGDAVPGSGSAGALDILRNVSQTAQATFFPEYEFTGFARGITYWRWEIVPLVQERPEPPYDVLVVISEITEQVRRRREVERLAGQLEAVVESMTEGVIIADSEANVIRMNAEALRLHGMGSEKEALRNLRDFPEFEVRDLAGNTLEPEEYPLGRVARGETLAAQEYKVRNLRTGPERVWSFGGAPVRDEQGRLILAVLTVADVTERVRAEERVATEKRRADLLAETAARLLPSLDPQGLVEELCTRVMTELDCHVFFNFLVIPGEERMHLNAYSGIPEEEARAIEYLDFGIAVCGCAARDAEPIVAEDILNTFDPRTDLVKSYGVQAYAAHPLWSEGKVIGTLSFGTRSRPHFSEDELAVMRAVTDLVAMAMTRIGSRQALEESEQRFHTMVDALPQLAWIARADGYIYWYNRRWYDYTGTTPEQMEGWGWRIVHDPQALPGVLDAWNRSLATGQPFDMEFPLRGADGLFRPFLTRVTPFKDEWGRVLQWFGTNTDISERRNAEEERLGLLLRQQELNEELSAANEELQCQTEELTAQTEQLREAYQDQEERAYLSEALVRVARAMHSSLEPDEVLSTGLAQGAEALRAETGALSMWEDGVFRISSIHGWPPEVLGRCVPAAKDIHAARVVQTGETVVVDDTSKDLGAERGFWHAQGVKSMIVAPCYLHGRPVAALSYGFATRRHDFTPAQVTFVNQLASSLSLALNNASLHKQQRSMLDRLQQPFLEMPGSLPSIDFAAEYRSATTGAQIGGDFYDLYLIPDGRLAMAVGDVSGHGLGAARFASMVKDSFSLLVLQGKRPRSVLAQTNRFLVNRDLPGFVTAFLGLLDLRTGELTYASAGHPPPLLGSPYEGQVQSLEFGGSLPLAALPEAVYTEGRAELRKDDVLLLYTDGLTDARVGDRLYGERGVAETLQRYLRRPVAELPGVLVAEALEFARGKLIDDIALLALRFNGPDGTGRGAD